MPALYSALPDVYPVRGHPAHITTANLFRKAITRGAHILFVDDSQAGLGGAFGGYALSLMLALNKATGCKIPGTPWVPCKPRSGTGGFYPAMQSYRNSNNIGTINQTKYPAGFAGVITPSPLPTPHDVSSSDNAFNIILQNKSPRTETNLTKFSPQLTDLLDRTSGNWYTEVLLGRCNNANIHGGTAGAEVKIEAWRGDTDMPWGSGSVAQVLNHTSSGLGLNTGTVDDPVVYRAGPISFGGNQNISVTWRSTSAGSKIRVAGARVWNLNAPGWFVHTFQEGGYRTVDSSSWYASHGNSVAATRAMFAGTPDGAPDAIFIGLGTNDLGSGKSATAWKADLKTLCNWLWAIWGRIIPVYVITEPYRADTATANYSTFIQEFFQQAGAVCELIDEGFGGVGNLFCHNTLLNWVRYYGSQDSSVLTGKAHLGNFTDYVNRAGSVAITQNVSYVSERRNGHYVHWLYTGSTTTIGAGGGINSERHGPGGDLYCAAANGTPFEIWTPLLQPYGRQGNIGPGAPNDFVHLCPTGGEIEVDCFVPSFLGAAASAPALRGTETMFTPSKFM